MPYIPHSEADRQAMLASLGVRSVAELFEDVPQHARFPELDLPPALSEVEARWELEALAGANFTAADGPCFLGAGAYRHFAPAVETPFFGGGSSTPPTRPTSRRSAREPCRPSLSTRA